ncbi:DUF4360 domain-containing protein [Pseudobacteriovorax antillogorgiicola]|uniref:DUF4360 domain-containing protein n=1 Tax=Pseudobacteriovorax antillogorgiicola TaxID=1513793 RepID=A0A1Y6BNF4_9BACT|nr:DUF4360 domain-containing protein [Pseudobacteriovorax antillogorgiicola]TCS53949.1 uncharacterized protein DUF4360 [Pseudobacteriovorax antillogorgiicola]SMF20129.1 protein of unknown function [Pseudobacteriovorax antillogorgiicola]
MNLSRLATLVAPAAIMVSSAAFATAPSGEVTIKDISYNGSGCPLGTVAENLAEDKKAFTLTFSDYIAEAGPGLTFSDGRKNCQITLNLKIPQGWQFSVGTFDYRGFVILDEDVQAEHSTSYYFQGSGFTGRFRERMRGFMDEYYQFRENVGLESLVWSSCNAERALNINTAISVRNLNKRDNPDALGVIGTDSVDGSIKQIWGIRWRRC